MVATAWIAAGDLHPGTFAFCLAVRFQAGFTDVMSVVFLVASSILLIGLVLMWFLPELPVSRASAAEERAVAPEA